MTREHKLALVMGFGLILFVGILITDHLAADTRLHEPLPAARIPDAAPISLLGRDTTRLEPETPARRELAALPQTPEIILEPVTDTSSGPARPLRSVDSSTGITTTDGPLAGRGMATPPPPTDRVHVVRKGETLTAIAKSAYGDAGLWRRIANANPQIDPRTLRPGTRLTIPSESPRSGRSVAPREVLETCTPAPSRPYTVRSGDSLANIAARELGSERRWREIQSLNGLRNDTIHPGQSLVLPVR